jgi:hypothetical protein
MLTNYLGSLNSTDISRHVIAQFYGCLKLRHFVFQLFVAQLLTSHSESLKDNLPN